MNRYLTTTLPYVNADPHIGFALELLQADVIARAWRTHGDSVFFTTGTDEHGQKIFQNAEAEGKEVQAYVDHFAGEVAKLKDVLGLSYDAFIRTTDPAHIAAAQELWKRCAAAGDIYKKKYKGYYCVADEAYVKESELVPNPEFPQYLECPNHPGRPLMIIEEENYFFKLSAYQEKIRAYLAQDVVIVPEWRRQEAIKFVEGGLEDFSISREIARMSWGVPVPGDGEQVMYVWFDALANYISTLGWPEDAQGDFKKYWEDGRTLQVAGKDQVRFQSLMWQAMLMSAQIKTTDQVFYHGFINSGGQKMSKSVGNVISPYELIEKYGTEATRYLLLRHVHPTEDTDVTWERLDEWYTANLVNGLGNLVARVMKLAQDNLSAPAALSETDTAVDSEVLARVEEFRFNEALDYVFEMIAESDALMTERAPFKKVKSEDAGIQEEGREDIALLVQHVARIASQLSVFMPETSKTILDAVRANQKPENLFPRLV